MEEKGNIYDDKQLKELMQLSKQKADDKLLYRIIHQIEAEQALRPKQVKSAKPLIKIIFSAAAVFYILAAILAVVTYYSGGLTALKSAEFIYTILGALSIASIYTCITLLDEKRYSK